MGTTYGPRTFTPLSLSPALWLSDTGSDPAVWEDLSGNGRNATQGTAANQPAIITNALNGRQVRRFDGGDSLIVNTGTFGSATTIFSVAKLSNIGGSGNYQRVVHLGDTIDQIGFLGSLSGNFATFFGNGVNWNDTTANTPNISVLNVWSVLNVINDNILAFPYVNGRVQNSKNGVSTTTTGLVVGNGRLPTTQYWNGDIAEILVFSTTLSTTNRRTVERYLAGKYGITIS